jgi:hypothetical protein
MRYGLSLLVLLSIAGCGREPASSVNTGTAATAASSKGPVVEETVAAVQQSPGKAAVALRFLLEGKPAVGAPIRVRLDFTAAHPIAQLTVHAQGAGLVVEDSGAAATLAMHEAGKTVSHEVSVTPQAAGFSQLIVRALPSDDGAAEIVYAIPLMTDAAPPAAN